MNALEQLKIQSKNIVRKSNIPLAIMISFGFLFFACNEMQNPVSELSETENLSIPLASATGVNDKEPVVIQNFAIKFNGNTYDSNTNTSTFSYTVSRGSDSNGFNYILFEVPSCAELKDYSPLASSSLTDNGIKWTNSIGANSSRDYQITYTGRVLTGMVDATIQGSGSGDIETKLIPGPCKGVYSISGFIYVDENGNQRKDIGEGGIDNVTVHLVKNGIDLADKKTSSNGSYSFNVYSGNGSKEFKLQVRNSSNSFLFDNFSPTTNPPELTAIVDNSDVLGKNLGFKAETGKIIEEFESEIIKLRTEKPGFWADEFKFSDKGRRTLFTKAQLLSFLSTIDSMDLTYKFDFGIEDSERIKKAENILSLKRQSTELEVLRANLLAAKLNVVSGNGAVDDKGIPLNEFNSLIIKTGAAAAVNLDPSFNSSLVMSSTINETYVFTTTSSITRSTGDLLLSFNGGGGGIGN
jgi:hypothetical protein